MAYAISFYLHTRVCVYICHKFILLYIIVYNTYQYTTGFSDAQWSRPDGTIHGGYTRSSDPPIHGYSVCSSGFEWLPNKVTWYIDGKVVRTHYGGRPPIPDKSAKIMMNLWIFGPKANFGGKEIYNNRYPMTSEYDLCLHGNGMGEAWKCFLVMVSCWMNYRWSVHSIQCPRKQHSQTSITLICRSRQLLWLH